MKIILLGGENPKNKKWIYDIAEKISTNFESEILEYKSWSENKAKVDIDLESQRLINLVNSINEPYVIFAKSIGTVLTIKSYSKFKIPPEFAIFVGVPFEYAKSIGMDLKKNFIEVNFSLSIFQKRFDPYSSLESLFELKSDFVKVGEFIGVNEPNDNHSYDDLDRIKKFIEENSNES